MSKIYVQKFPAIFEYSGSLASSGSLSGSNIKSDGYARIVGGAISSGSGVDSASAIRVKQSFDAGTNWDFITCCALSACSGSAFSIEVVGNMVSVEYWGDTTASTAEVRAWWALRPV